MSVSVGTCKGAIYVNYFLLDYAYRAGGIIYLSLILLFLIAFPIHADEVMIATGVNHDPPYVYGDLEIIEPYPGVTIGVLKLIELKTNSMFNILKLPWARVVAEVKSSELNGDFHFSFSEDRKSLFVYPILGGQVAPDHRFSISNRSYFIYSLKDQAFEWNGSRISSRITKNIRIGVIRGSSIIRK